ncbi:proton-conducting transporter membrane subunit [Botrimarina mediterranea]|uniref:Probable inorganic carbon transporter subunit DabB n=1 Tax=Botrimarina mediterranea TaxID=2528022 RepID=A0A518KCQ8_9BACT|nr:proton-conducting transporter membrane subunit [Botrimarina mediterranea]QDV75568.1 NADH-quinone oxidoreductase subunit L [Botrimarina mediterranea]QDV80202.1 NADH-quinone oxidoreductase subunit L [Planctomycetes bacterium K2D]
MTTIVLVSLISSAFMLFLFGAAPSAACNRRPVAIRSAVTLLAGWQSGLALIAMLGRLSGVVDPIAELRWPPVGPLACGVFLDGVSGLVFLLVSFIGLIVCQYSIRYLDGDPRQGDYFRWVAATIGSVSLLVLSGNLLMLVLAWVATSLSLHQLLLHYPGRSGARRAAWKKFAISRAGDIFLVVALLLAFREFATFDLSAIFAAVAPGQVLSAERDSTLAWVSWLVVLGGITKSAQFPLHSWLPETLETPTPVSALMHAGVVNAGGYLIIRLSPLLVHQSSALDLLTVVGTATAAYGGVVMLTQSSVKKALAYSTVAQMGFMMLQCGLGAFSAAMLHLVSHSLYKAYAFLNSGNVLKDERASRVVAELNSARRLRLTQLPLIAAASIVGSCLIAWLMGFDVSSKPGGYALAAIFCLALTMGIWESLKIPRQTIRRTAALAAAGLTVLYISGYLAIDSLVGANVAHFPSDGRPSIAGGVVVIAFFGLAALQVLLRLPAAHRRRDALYVHAINGFYVDAAILRVAGPRLSKR